jgi:hypothetical protein
MTDIPIKPDLLAFAQDILANFPNAAPDEYEIQEIAITCGLLIPTAVAEACSENCACADYGDFPAICYRKASILREKSE